MIFQLHPESQSQYFLGNLVTKFYIHETNCKKIVFFGNEFTKKILSICETKILKIPTDVFELAIFCWWNQLNCNNSSLVFTVLYWQRIYKKNEKFNFPCEPTLVDDQQRRLHTFSFKSERKLNFFSICDWHWLPCKILFFFYLLAQFGNYSSKWKKYLNFSCLRHNTVFMQNRFLGLRIIFPIVF